MSHLTQTIRPFTARRIALGALLVTVATIAVVLALAAGGGSATSSAAPVSSFKGVDESSVAAAVGKGRERAYTLPNTSAPRPR